MLTHRRVRWLTVAVSFPVLLACVDRQLGAPSPRIEGAETDVFVQNPQLQLDIVFMIDNSDSMQDKQRNLIANFPTFMQVLEGAVPAGSTLDAHIGIVSSDLGVFTSGVGNCDQARGDDGAFQNRPHGACTAVPRDSYIVTGAAGNNFTGAITDVFSCIAALGTGGCGFEHQLASVRRALGGDPAVPMPAGNAGFLRRDARLGIILITDEDDCSAPEGSDLFSATSRLLSDPYGPLESYRCNEYGHLCGSPPAPPPRGAVASLDDCHSNETSSARLIAIREFVDFFRSLKSDPDLLRVAVVTGPAAPYGTHITTKTVQGLGTIDVVEVDPSCNSNVGAAAPAVRLGDFVDAFGPNGLHETICTNDFGPAMRHIAEALVPPTRPCTSGQLYDGDPQRPGVQADCTVTETRVADDTGRSDQAVPGCDAAGGGTPCWRLEPDPVCGSDMSVVVDHGGASVPSNLHTSWSCRICLTPEGVGCAP